MPLLFSYSTLSSFGAGGCCVSTVTATARSEEHTSELQSLRHLVCRPLLISTPATSTLFPYTTLFRSHRGVIPRILEGRAKVPPGGRIERVEHLRAVERQISDAAPFFVQHVVEFRRRRLLCVDRHRDGEIGRAHV